MSGSHPWWREAVLYQIYPRSFCDTTGNGIGDLDGIRRHLDHLMWLGVDAVWLSPIQPSPNVDFGYDVADYCDVDEAFGGLAAFDQLLAACHDRGLRLLLDWVPNHTSDQHPWFREARADRANPKRDWYVWRDGDPSTPPNNWMAAFPYGPAWSWDDATDAWYLHLFTPQQPDLNWANPEVEAAMLDTLRFWLDRGVDGFRMDVIHAIGKDPQLADHSDDIAALPATVLNHRPETHEHLRRIRALVDSYPGDRVALGEVYLLDAAEIAAHYGAGDELHLCFNFPLLHAPWDIDHWRLHVQRTAEVIDPAGWPAWVLSSHDAPRHRTRYGSESRARAAAMALLTLRGTPVVYMGEELGLEDAVIPADRAVDPGGRDGCRAPMPWTAEPDHGWASPDPWLPWPPHAGDRSARAERVDETSVAHLYRRILQLRRRSDALRRGSSTLLDAPAGVLAWDRVAGDDRRRVLISFGDAAADVSDLARGWATELESEPGALTGGRLDGDRGVILRPS